MTEVKEGGHFYWINYPEDDADVIVFGVPLGRRAKLGIERLRRTSWFVESFDLDTKKDIEDRLKIFDSGDIEIKDYPDMRKVSEKVRGIIEKNKISLMLGGGHLCTYYAFKSFPKNTKLVIFDCHCDIKDEYMDSKMIDLDYISDDAKLNPRVNDVTWLRRLYEIVDPKNIILLGVRSGSEDEFNFIEKNRISYLTTNMIKDDLPKAKKNLKDFVGDSDVYINVDIDVFDPAYAPAVDQPEPNGIDFSQFSELVNSIKGRLVGIDLVCFQPMEGNEVTEFLGVRVLYEVLKLIIK